jgi:hypothetical protein
MNANVATVVKGGQAIFDIDIEAGRNKLISHLLYNFILNPSMAATSNPFQRDPGGWGVLIQGNHAARRETAHHGGNVCVMCVFC